MGLRAEMKQPGTQGRGGRRAHVAGIGAGVGDASTQHGISQQVHVNPPAVSRGDDVDLCAHEFLWIGRCKMGGGLVSQRPGTVDPWVLMGRGWGSRILDPEGGGVQGLGLLGH